MPDPKKRIAVTGAGGMLGRAVLEELSRRGHTAVPLGRETFDFTRSANWGPLPAGLDSVVNCAAYTAVDDAESDEGAATEANAVAVGRLAERCGEAGVSMVHVSTDYVFDGAASAPYAVDHPREPATAYGRSKLAGERALEVSGADWLCVRTSWLHGAWGGNFVRTILGALETRNRLDVVDDQRGRPTEVCSLAELLLDAHEAETRGFLHGCDGGEATWFDLARAVAASVGRENDIHPTDSSAFPRPAPRPGYSVLSLGETERLLGPRPHWSEPLQRSLEQLHAPPFPPANSSS